MTFAVQVKIMPLDGLLDPQGKAVIGGLQNLKITQIEDVRIGKSIELKINAATAEEARDIATDAANKLLANAVMEHFTVEVSEKAA